MALATYSRAEFLGYEGHKGKFTYEPGESIGIICPTGGGKTFTGWQLADVALRQNPELGFTAFQPKPSDSTTSMYAERYGFPVKAEYPFRRKFLEPKSRGYIHWPAHIRGDADANAEHLEQAFKNSINGEYWAGNKLLLVDDEFLISQMYKCQRETDTVLTAGRSNGVGMIFCLQQPKGTNSAGGVSTFHYSQPTHLLLGKDGVEGNRKRFGEIAMGIDPATIDHIVKNLKVYRINRSAVSELLYLNRMGPYACIVRPA